MDISSPRARSNWRFSLRELLLLILAIGAFLGWATIAYRQRFVPTLFYRNNDNWQQEVKAVYDELGETGFEPATISMTFTSGPTGARRTYYGRIPISPANRSLFLDTFEKRVREKMKSEGCDVDGLASASGSNSLRILGYHLGQVHGTFEICIMDSGGDGKVGVIVTMLEQNGQLQEHGVFGNIAN